MKFPLSILITGASSGIGAALATAYAGPNMVLMLSGRDVKRLSQIAKICIGKGATVFDKVIDVRDQKAMASWINEVESTHPLDLIVANAGISAGTGGPEGEADTQVRQIFDININGVLNTIHPAIDHMRARRRGQIVIVSSIAGFRGMPTAPAYSASKAAVKSYGEGLRGYLKNDGIEVSVVCPGFVKSRITAANHFPMPFLMDADKAAKIIKRNLATNKGRIVFPWQMLLITWLFVALPTSWTDRLLSRMPRKT